MDPYAGLETSEVGILRERLLNLDVFEHLGIPSTSISAALLGELAKGPVAQLTVHTEALGEVDNSSFTFLVPQKVLFASGAIRGDLVSLHLIGASVPGTLFWRCDRFERI